MKPQKEDGLVKSPAANSGFHDAFKLDWESHNVIVKDLPSKEAKCSVRKRVSTASRQICFCHASLQHDSRNGGSCERDFNVTFVDIGHHEIA